MKTFKFDKVLKKLREVNNVKKADLVRLLHISGKNYNELESGNRFPTLVALDKLAEFYNVSISFLLIGQEFDNHFKEINLEKNDCFSLWFYKWLYDKQQDVTFNQISSYICIAQYILKDFCYQRLKDITKADIKQLLKTHVTLSKRSLSMMRSIFNQVYSFAIDERVYDYNPSINISIPKEAKNTVETKPVSLDIGNMILSFSHPLQPAAVIMLLAGLRRGELLALRYSDIRLADGVIVVNKVVENRNGVSLIRHRAKTENSIREIIMAEKLIDFFIKYFCEHPNLDMDSFIVPSTSEKPVSIKQFQRKWNSYIRELNARFGDFSDLHIKKSEIKSPADLPLRIERFTTKQLRHTYATMLYKSNVDVLTAKEQMGHKSIVTTLNIYTHLDEVYKKKKIASLDDYLNNTLIP